MADIFVRKGVLTLSEARTMLATDPVFTSLTETEQNTFINNAVQEVSILRNNQEKEDYNADSVDIDLVA